METPRQAEPDSRDTDESHADANDQSLVPAVATEARRDGSESGIVNLCGSRLATERSRGGTCFFPATPRPHIQGAPVQ
jgi:hypothetical protein